MRQTWKMLCQTALLSAIYLACDEFARRLNLPVPGNVLGIVLLFLLLASGIVKEQHISGAAEFLLRHLVFFFVPIAVGLMEWGGVFYDYGWVLLAAIVGSTALPLLITGFMGGALRSHAPKEAQPCSR